MRQDAYMTALRLALNERTGRPWSLRKGRLTSHDKIYVSSPSDRKRPELGTVMSRIDRDALASIFNLPTDTIMDMVVIGPDQYESYLRMARGELE